MGSDPKRTPIIFLDIDGVLNSGFLHPKLHYATIDPVLARRLGMILEETDARIVLISAWRYLVHGGSMTLSGLRALFLSHWIDGTKIIDITRKDATKTRSDRGPQISEWLSANPERVSRYLVIDNMDLEVTACGHPLILVDGSIGLTDSNVAQAIFFLKEGVHP